MVADSVALVTPEIIDQQDAQPGFFGKYTSTRCIGHAGSGFDRLYFQRKQKGR